jgi:hypothetical protein
MPVQLTDYTNLVTSEHFDQPNFQAVLAAVLQGYVDRQNVMLNLPSSFDLDLAQGAQLDVLGEWVGISRSLRVPIANVYFSFGIAGVGFGEGIWWNPRTQPLTELISMDDVTYRLMIRAKIAANIWDGTLAHGNYLLAQIFPDNGVGLIDNFDMTYSITIDGTAPSKLFAQLVAQGYIPLKPAGVGLI